MKNSTYLFLFFLFVTTLTSCTKVGQIHGTVKDSETGDLIENAKVEISPGNMSSILTNSTGEFNFSDLTEGLYKITVSKDGYETTSRDFTIQKGQTSNADFTLTEVEILELAITTSNATNITATTASIVGNITELGESDITAHGHCWSNSAAPTVNLSTKTDKGSTNSTANIPVLLLVYSQIQHIMSELLQLTAKEQLTATKFLLQLRAEQQPFQLPAQQM